MQAAVFPVILVYFQIQLHFLRGIRPSNLYRCTNQEQSQKPSEFHPHILRQNSSVSFFAKQHQNRIVKAGVKMEPIYVVDQTYIEKVFPELWLVQ